VKIKTFFTKAQIPTFNKGEKAENPNLPKPRSYKANKTKCIFHLKKKKFILTESTPSLATLQDVSGGQN